MIHPDTELRFISSEIGYGVFATRLIPQGTITWALDELDQVLQPGAVAALSPMQRQVFDKYAYVDASCNHVLCWDLGRFMNHSCDPSVRGIGYGFDIAVRDIHPGEELTCDYSTLNITESFQCGCGATNCRGVVQPDDILQHWQSWDAAFAQAFSLITSVPQPLWTIAIENNYYDQPILEVLLARGEPLPSCLDYYVSSDIIEATLTQQLPAETWQKQSLSFLKNQKDLSAV